MQQSHLSQIQNSKSQFAPWLAQDELGISPYTNYFRRPLEPSRSSHQIPHTPAIASNAPHGRIPRPAKRRKDGCMAPSRRRRFGTSPNCARRAGENSSANYVLRSEEHTSELQSRQYLVCRLLLEKKKNNKGVTGINFLFVQLVISTAIRGSPYYHCQ